MATGPVRVQIEAASSEPALDQRDWMDVTEFSLPHEHAEGDYLALCMLDGEHAPVREIADAPGPLRVRVAARNRDYNFDGVAYVPVEEYLIQVWPAPTAPISTLKAKTDLWSNQ